MTCPSQPAAPGAGPTALSRGLQAEHPGEHPGSGYSPAVSHLTAVRLNTTGETMGVRAE